MSWCPLFCSAHGQANLSRRWTKLLPISFALFSGMLGTQSVLFSKALSTLLRTTFDGDSQLDTWFFYVLLLLFICTAAFWVSRLNKVSLACLHRAVCLLLLLHSPAGLALDVRVQLSAA